MPLVRGAALAGRYSTESPSGADLAKPVTFCEMITGFEPDPRCYGIDHHYLLVVHPESVKRQTFVLGSLALFLHLPSDASTGFRGAVDGSPPMPALTP
jgi:hypothetical protein